MKTTHVEQMVLGLCFLLAALALPALPAHAATNDITSALQRGLFEEEANRNLDAAIQAYQTVASQFYKDRKLAATAIFRLGECYRKQGNTNDAAAQYERILRDFSDQPTLVTLSRQNLAGLGATPTAPAAPVMSDAARQEQKRLLDEEMKLVQKQMEALQQQRDANGAISPGDPLPLQRQMLELKRQVAALDAGLPLSVTAAEAPATTTSTDADEVKRIQALIKDSPDLINAPDKNRETLLQSAAAKGNLAVVRLLLDSGAAVDGLRQPSLTALHYAAANGHKAVVDLLLSKGAKADSDQSWGGITPLHVAAQKGYEEVARVLLVAGASANAKTIGNNDFYIGGVRCQFELGQTPLHLATAAGYAELAELLLAKGADANAEDGAGRTPLHLAAKGGTTGLVKLLLAKGANVNAQDREGRTPLSYAADANSEAIAQLLLAAHADPNAGRSNLPLVIASAAGDMPTLKLLLANGADPNTNNAKGWPLLGAVLHKHADAVAELLRFKANPNRPTGDGDPLTFLALPDALTLKALLDGGADPNARSRSRGGTPLLLQAAVDRNQPAVELLLGHHAEVNCTTDAAGVDGTTPLLGAVKLGNEPVAELLLKAGADVNARLNNNAGPRSGYTSLHEAVRQGRPELVELLLVSKADPNAKCSGGWTPLHLAVSLGQRELAELLLANKADPNVRNDAGATPLDIAKRQPSPAQGASPGMYPPGIVAATPGNPPPIGLGLPTPGVSGTGSRQESKAETMVGLLRRHGALDELPSPDRIMVQRRATGFSETPFAKGTKDWNQFTILDLLGEAYGLLARSPSDMGDTVQATPSVFFGSSRLPFPDLAHIRIRRPTADMRSWQEHFVDLSPVLLTGDCSKDAPLSWGDVVEIPEADHPLNEDWVGFSEQELLNLKECLTRHIQIVIKGQANSITLTPHIAPQIPGTPLFISANIPFWLKPALLRSKLVLVSSDLSRVKVTRHDPASGQERQWVVDCAEASPAPDLWLRDGDKVEVPEKSD